MTKQDYEIIAGAIATAVQKTKRTEGHAMVTQGMLLGITRAALCLAQALLHENEKFDSHKFLMACDID